MRYIEKILMEICDEEGIDYQSFCDGYFLKITKNNKSTFVFDNIFDNNSAAVYKILKDKSALSELLLNQNIPCAKHYYFSTLDSSNDNIIKSLLKLLKKYKRLVIKPNEGTSGNDVFLVDNEQDLIKLSSRIFEQSNTLTASPFLEIKHEYRVVMLNGKIKLIFDKIRPFITGNGRESIEILTQKKYKNQVKIDESLDLNYIPKSGEEIILSWRHNLNFGATPEVVTDEKIISKLTELTDKTHRLIGFNFASVDIIELADENYQILEINGSVCMGKFAGFSKENYNTAKAIYKQAILENFRK